MMKSGVFFLSLLFVITSCSSNEEINLNPADEAVDIAGSWELTGMEGEGEAVGEFNGQVVILPYELLGKDFDAQVDFTVAPNEMISTGTLLLEITVGFPGQTETIVEMVTLSDEFATAFWSIDGNILTLEREGAIQTAEIILLTQNKMVLLVAQTRAIMGLEATSIQEVTLER